MQRYPLANIGLWAFLGSVACDPGVATQVLVRFDADDAARERAHFLRVRVIPAAGDARTVTEPLKGDQVRVTWPATQPVHPGDESTDSSFTVIGELLDVDRNVFNQQTAIGRYVLGERREVLLRFETSCSDQIACEQGETCFQGACAPACVLPTAPGLVTDRTPPRPCATHAKELTIPGDQILANATDFPLLVAVTADADLASLAMAGGTDVGFVDALDGTLLDHELVAFDSELGSLVAWVRIPELTAGIAHSVEMLFGGTPIPSRAERVWSGYRGVWHLESTDGTARDSSPYALAAVDAGPFDVVGGQVGEAFSMSNGRTLLLGDPDDDHLDFNIEQSFGASAWVRLSDQHSSFEHVFYKGGSDSTRAGYVLAVVDSEVRARASDGNGTNEAGRVALVFGEWTHIAFVVDRAAQVIRVYTNGEEVGLTADVTGIDVNPAPGLDTPAYLGGTGGCCELDGDLDEVTLWEGLRSNARIRMEYENQSNPTAFVRIGALETF